MKKYLKIAILSLLIFMICACGKKEEYHLIELSGNELISNINSKGKNFIFAFYNENQDNAADFLKDLETSASLIKDNIYYVNSFHLQSGPEIILETNTALDVFNNSFYVYEDGNFIVAQSYEDFTDLYGKIKKYQYKSEMNYNSEEYIKEQLTKSQEEYDKGNIAISIEYLNGVWNQEEAKKTYNERKYYNILNSWESYEFYNDNLEDMIYHGMIFYYDNKTYYEITKKDKFGKDFVKPNDLGDYTKKYYYIKNDIIYTSKTEDGEYKEEYKITYLSPKNVILESIKDNKKIEYKLRI